MEPAPAQNLPATYLYMDTHGQSKGPLTANVLLKMLRKGVGVTGHTMVWTVGMAAWACMREVEPFCNEAALEAMAWYYVDAESGEQKGPVPSRLLLHYMEEGKIDGLTLVFNQKQNAWVQLGQVPELKQVMRQMMEEEEQRATLENQVADSDQVFLEDSSIPVIPDEMKQAGASRGTKRSFQADNGKHFVWDDAENDWVEDENPSGSEESEDEDAHWKKGNTKDEKKTTGVSSAAAEGGEGEGVAGQDDKAAARKKKKKKKKATWNDNASGLWVYVTGLPSDVTAEELKSHFSKVGLIAISPIDQQPKIKIYRNPDGSVKGDCSICFNAPESVAMALELLDEGYLRIGTKISVTKAEFQKKEGVGDDNGYDFKRPRPTISHAQVKVAQSISKQALAWNEDDDLGVSKKRALKIIVLEGMFTPAEAKSDKFMAELEQDIVSECEKCGSIEKITVFSQNPKGVVIVKFATAFAAQECVRILDGRFFGGQKVKAYFWDGNTNYSVPLSEAEAVAAVAEEEKRLKEFGDWLDKEQEDLPDELKLRVEN